MLSSAGLHALIASAQKHPATQLDANTFKCVFTGGCVCPVTPLKAARTGTDMDSHTGIGQ